MSYPTAGRYQRTPVPRIWSLRWLALTAFFAGQVGTWFIMLIYGVGNFWPVQLLALVLAFVGLVWSAKQVTRAFIFARQLWTLCDNVYGPAADGATVIIRPAPHPEVPGEVVVEYPE